jgi:ABC-2 type transport system permease protein
MSALASQSVLNSYFLESKFEFLRLLRTPAFSVPAVLFAPLFYLLFGVLLSRGQGGEAARYLLWTYAVFGVAGNGLFAFGVTVALEREQGYLRYKRALPMPPGAYIFAKMAMALMFALITICLLAVLSSSLGKVSMTPAQWGIFFALNIVGVLPFCALGLWIGTVLGGQGAPAIVNLIYLPMAFLSGLWLPLTILPKLLQTLAPVWPSFHLSQIGLSVINRAAGGSLLVHGAYLLIFTLVFALLAKRRLALSN